MLSAKIQPQSFLGSGEEVFFLQYMDLTAILFNCAEVFEQKQMAIPFQQKAPLEIW